MSRYESRPRYGPREGKAFKFCLQCRLNLADLQWAKTHGMRPERKPLCQMCASAAYKRMMVARGDKVRLYDKLYKARQRSARRKAALVSSRHSPA